VAAILFVGAVASNLIASYLETTLKPYSRWVWIMFAIALIVAVATGFAQKVDEPLSERLNSEGVRKFQPRVASTLGLLRSPNTQLRRSWRTLTEFILKYSPSPRVETLG
jgi:hypothetical protein